MSGGGGGRDLSVLKRINTHRHASRVQKGPINSQLKTVTEQFSCFYFFQFTVFCVDHPFYKKLPCLQLYLVPETHSHATRCPEPRSTEELTSKSSFQSLRSPHRPGRATATGSSCWWCWVREEQVFRKRPTRRSEDRGNHMDTRVVREQQPGACVQGRSRGQPMLGWRQRAGPGSCVTG